MCVFVCGVSEREEERERERKRERKREKERGRVGTRAMYNLYVWKQ